jgi:hypothetical protein
MNQMFVRMGLLAVLFSGNSYGEKSFCTSREYTRGDSLKSAESEESFLVNRNALTDVPRPPRSPSVFKKLSRSLQSLFSPSSSHLRASSSAPHLQGIQGTKLTLDEIIRLNYSDLYDNQDKKPKSLVDISIKSISDPSLSDSQSEPYLESNQRQDDGAYKWVYGSVAAIPEASGAPFSGNEKFLEEFLKEQIAEKKSLQRNQGSVEKSDHYASWRIPKILQISTKGEHIFAPIQKLAYESNQGNQENTNEIKALEQEDKDKTNEIKNLTSAINLPQKSMKNKQNKTFASKIKNFFKKA